MMFDHISVIGQEQTHNYYNNLELAPKIVLKRNYELAQKDRLDGITVLLADSTIAGHLACVYLSSIARQASGFRRKRDRRLHHVQTYREQCKRHDCNTETQAVSVRQKSHSDVQTWSG
jgi:hypothetical protein